MISNLDNPLIFGSGCALSDKAIIYPIRSYEVVVATNL